MDNQDEIVQTEQVGESQRCAEIRESEKLSTPGEYLQGVRESKGISVDAAAEVLKLTPTKLRALEADQFEKLPSSTFVRGYVRAYARLLELDIEDSVKRYDDYLQALRATTVSVVTPENSSAPLAHLKKRAVIALILGLVLLSVTLFWLRNQTSAEATVQAAPIATQEPAALVVNRTNEIPASELLAKAAESNRVAATDSISNNTIDSSVNSLLKAPAEPAGNATLQAETTANAALQTEATARAQLQSELTTGLNSAVSAAADASAGAALAAAQDALLFNFSSDCWVQVIDASGEVLVSDLRRAGSQLTISGSAPFDVVLGDAAGVQLSLNDTPVDVSPKGNRKSRRLKVSSET